MDELIMFPELTHSPLHRSYPQEISWPMFGEYTAVSSPHRRFCTAMTDEGERLCRVAKMPGGYAVTFSCRVVGSAARAHKFEREPDIPKFNRSSRKWHEFFTEVANKIRGGVMVVDLESALPQSRPSPVHRDTNNTKSVASNIGTIRKGCMGVVAVELNRPTQSELPHASHHFHPVPCFLCGDGSYEAPWHISEMRKAILIIDAKKRPLRPRCQWCGLREAAQKPHACPHKKGHCTCCRYCRRDCHLEARHDRAADRR